MNSNVSTKLFHQIKTFDHYSSVYSLCQNDQFLAKVTLKISEVDITFTLDREC